MIAMAFFPTMLSGPDADGHIPAPGVKDSVSTEAGRLGLLGTDDALLCFLRRAYTNW